MTKEDSPKQFAGKHIPQHDTGTDLLYCFHRHLFLDAALLMRGHPWEHLVEAWAGILQQQEDEYGVQNPSTAPQLRKAAEAMWSVCAGATLVSCQQSEGEPYYR